LLDAEELVDGRVYLIADFFTRLQAHHNKLGMFACEQHLTEIIVLQGQFFDISNETGHRFYLLGGSGEMASSYAVYSNFSTKPGK
jgi:hypothetical protein